MPIAALASAETAGASSPPSGAASLPSSIDVVALGSAPGDGARDARPQGDREPAARARDTSRVSHHADIDEGVVKRL